MIRKYFNSPAFSRDCDRCADADVYEMKNCKERDESQNMTLLSL